MRFSHLFFDLDGTLIDSRPGIFNSLYAMLRRLKTPESSWPADLNPFIGPPLRESFKSLFGFDDEMAETATSVYREFYSRTGINEFTVYPGITEALNQLREAGFNLSVVTSKAESYAVKMISKAGFSDLFTTISGCEINGKRSEKAELINYTLDRLGLQPSKQILMIGDRYHDIRGARSTGISGAAVLYGYGTYDELSPENPDLFFDSPEDIADQLLFNFIK